MIIDTEVHLMHTESCKADFAQGSNEPVRKAIHDHSDWPIIKNLMTVEALLESMERNNVSHCHIMGMSWRKKDWHDPNNTYIEEIVKSHPQKFTGMYIPHLGDIQKACDEVRNINKDIFLGVKLLTSWQGRSVNEKALFPLYEEVMARDMYLMVHTDHITQSLDGDTPQKLMDLVLNFPNLKILAPHMGGLLCQYELLPKFREILKNVVYISSVSSTMEFVRYASEMVEDKIVFGTDFPFNHCHSQEFQIQKLSEMQLSDEVVEKILFKNAMRLFNYKFSQL
jgi:predicted TIM-barrel fold metal-dependent hydrolase